jgi:amino acid adenylation domain-containing protein
MTTLDQRIANLSPEKRAHLEQHLLAKASQGKPKHIIPRRAPAESYPLSFAQERMWFLEQLYPDSATYNEQSIYRLKGTLNMDALRQSMQMIVQRHEILRTVYRQVDDKAMQVVLPQSEIDLQLFDLRNFTAQKQESEIYRLATQDSNQPFDLVKGPVYRAQLLQVAENEHVLIHTRHHIATDGWSTGVYWREFNQLYNAYSEGRTPSLPELPIQYADYALWQREWLAGDAGKEQVAYWLEQLADLTPLDLPKDAPRRSSTNNQGGVVELTLPSELTSHLRELAQRESSTLFMLLLAAFQLLLHRLADQDDIAIGTPIANRNRMEIENLIGCILNTLVLRTDLAGNPSFAELLQRVRKTTLDAFQHQDPPIEKIIEELQPARHLHRSPLFQVFINMLDNEGTTPQPGNLIVERITFEDPHAKFDMTLYVRRVAEGMRLRLVYRTDLYSAERMNHFLGQYVYLLTQIVQQPDQPISAYSLVTPQSRALLPDPTQPLAEPSYPGVLETFLEVAKREPERIAIEQGGQQWSYGQLAATASTIAIALQKSGMKPQQVVAISGPRSFELFSSLLGVMCCAGIFMLLDRSLPEKRREIMLAEANTDFLIEIQEDVSQGSQPAEITLASLKGELSQSSVNLAQPEPKPGPIHTYASDDPLYIFFTSGSTGKPKGIRGCYKSLNHFIHWQRQTFQISSTDRVAQLTMLSFDPILRDIFLPLTSGATLCIPPIDLTVDDELFWLSENRITVLHTVPSRVRLWLQRSQRRVNLSLSYTFFVGEALYSSLAKEWRVLCSPDSVIVNLYGHTETGPAKGCYTLPPEPVDGIQPIDQVQPESQLLIVNQNGHLCGVGEPGEILVRTPFLTLGYLNPQAEDARRFQTNWFTGQSGDILYRTGDRGRYQPDKTIRILGRLDHQVKVAGVRVDVQEIEAVLSKYPGIMDCAIVATEKSPGEVKLNAYIVLAQGDLNSDDLRRHLAAWLLMPMIPSAFVPLPRLPRLPNGKVDRHALSALPLPAAQVTQPPAKPRDLLDAQMKAIWASVLNLPSVDLDDNFFDLGGHSLLAVTLFAQIEQLTGKRLPLSILFEAPTVRHLADAMRGHDWRSPWQSLVAVQPNGYKRPIFLVPPAGGSALRFNKLASLLSADRPIFSFDSLGLDGLAEPHQTVEEMAAAYILELRLIQPTGPYLVGGMCYGAHVALEMAQQLQAGEQEVSLLLILDAGAPANGPTWARVVPKRTPLRYIERTIYHLQQKSMISIVLLPKLTRLVQRVVDSTNPVKFRIAKVKHAHLKAQYNYSGRTYNGNLILFQTEDYFEKGYSEQWMEISPNLTLYVMPGTKHREILRSEPYLQQWTAQLRNHLDSLA